MDATISFTAHLHTPLRALDKPPRELLIQSLTNLITSCPPEKAAQETPRMGFFQGPTSIAYLFFHLSKTHQQLQIHGKTPLAWFEDYFNLPVAESGIEPADDQAAGGIGIASEYYCHMALDAAHTQNSEPFLGAVEKIELGDVQEVLLGSAGLLILLRFVREFVAATAEKIHDLVKRVIAHITASSWLFHSREYTGAVHGNIGIITQVCLSGGASTVEGRLSAFLALQQEDGNWYSTTDRKHEHMQWCHGAAGCVISLLAIRKYFPVLEGRIQSAIHKSQRLIFEKGVIEKEPCLCHGATGNALALDKGQRDHLLSFATPEAITAIEWDISSDPAGLYWGEAGRAWVCAMLDGGKEGFPAYTDV